MRLLIFILSLLVSPSAYAATVSCDWTGGGARDLKTAGNASLSETTGSLDALDLCFDSALSSVETLSGTVTWGSTPVLETGSTFTFGDGTDATILYTYDVSGTDLSVLVGNGAMAIAGDLTSTSFNGISSGDLADTSSNETIDGDWDFSNGGIEIENGTTPPSCTVGQIYQDTNATAGQQLMACEGGTFVVQGAGGSGDVTSVGDCGGPDCFAGTSEDAGDPELFSDTGLIIQLDQDNNGDEVFEIRDGANAIGFRVQEDGTILTLVGLDAIGAVDMDYGSADVTDHRFITDGTGDGEITLPDGSIGTTEILDATVSAADLGADSVSASELNASGVASELETAMNHDNLTGFVANEHVDWTASTTNFVTTGTITGDIDIVSTTTTTDSPACTELRGSFHTSNNASGTDYTLPEISTCGAGASACWYDLNGGGVVTLDSAAGDIFILDGLALDAADAIDSAGAVGDFICILAVDNTNWLTLGRSGTWIDGGVD